MENWRILSHLFVTMFLSNFSYLIADPAIPDVSIAALCPGKDECSAAIYLTGFQQAVSGLGSVIVTPLLGNLSDAYGRKASLALPLYLGIIPNGHHLLLVAVVLAWKREKSFLYAYYVLKSITDMFNQSGLCLALAYAADNVSAGNRVSAFGLLSGVIFSAYVGGTLAARLLSTIWIFQVFPWSVQKPVAAAAAVASAIYMTVFLKDTKLPSDALEQPILKETESNEDSVKESEKMDLSKKIPSPKDIFCLLKSSFTFSLAASVAFFNSLAEGGLRTCLLYFLKARFHFGKDQFADVLLIAYIGAALSNMIFMPIFGPAIGEETLLSIATFAGFLNMFVDSIAWASWGLAQGCILGITSFANVITPLIYSPLSALFLSEKPPFDYQGFGILCVGLAWLAGFFLSILIKVYPSSRNKCNRELA
ncbi:hippocampus abundant transcript 1 protein-like [Dorcoceras hygrometricum]|uniref:Hippocampus abundant transcript 1 protein-like n=1 Tax=Dorcoceras hygrometricum TaxID=472368 RepID=A0A2Z7C5D3_9LAMI|nr:hippocampus abundant transcript 1 protein-like [Dorcoceras hygrometricum]